MKFKIFDFAIFCFNLYVYYLTLCFIASIRPFNLQTRTVSVPTRAFNLAARAFSPLIRGFELVNCGFELITRVLLLHIQLM